MLRVGNSVSRQRPTNSHAFSCHWIACDLPVTRTLRLFNQSLSDRPHGEHRSRIRPIGVRANTEQHYIPRYLALLNLKVQISFI